MTNLRSMTVDRLNEIASKTKEAAPPVDCGADPSGEELENAIQESVLYLKSNEAMDSLCVDAYWPKWHSPWWHMILLHEMGLESLIPVAVLDKVVDALSSDYLKYFPLIEEEVPSEIDPVRHIACHCQLGTMYRLLTACGVSVRESLPWIRPWFVQYQQNDGGLNCDESAYTKPTPKSSIVSTLPPLEAVLDSPDELSEKEIEFLDRGARYLMRKRLFRTETTGTEIDENWLRLSFPRFYHYDVLRGLSFLLDYSVRLKRPLPAEVIEESLILIDDSFPDGIIKVERQAWGGATTRYLDASLGEWTKGPAATFPLLEQVGRTGAPSLYLTKQWINAKTVLRTVIAEGLLLNN